MKPKLTIRLIPSIESHAHVVLTNLIHEMLQVNPKERPGASELHDLFNTLVDMSTNAIVLEKSKCERNNALFSKICQPLSYDDNSEPDFNKDQLEGYT